MVLEATIDAYNGVNVSSKSLPEDEMVFGRELEQSIEKWRSEGRKGVWIRIPQDKASFLPIALAVPSSSTRLPLLLLLSSPRLFFLKSFTDNLLYSEFIARQSRSGSLPSPHHLLLLHLLSHLFL